MVRCDGCGSFLKRSGIVQHCRLSRDPACRAFLGELLGAAKEVTDQLETAAETLQDEAQADDTGGNDIGIDTSGDLFGDYNFLDEDVDCINDANESNRDATSPDSESESDEEGKESCLEPTRPLAYTTVAEPQSQDGALEDGWEDDIASGGLDNGNHRCHDGREGVETRLEQHPFVVHYPSPRDADPAASGLGETSGTCSGQNEHTTPANDQYFQSNLSQGSSTTVNLYAPFTSRLDWEIAKWAKLRGPGSTAFNDLMAIKTVPERLGLSFKTSQELNQIIDEGLPGRPPFKRHELLVDDEVCEVYYRDIVACVRALFGDPDYAPVLAFQPEKHYVDEERKERMYHDMHTGRWWWHTQKAVDAVKPGGTIIPIIISTDKTQLTLFRNKSSYPIYMTIGNIPKEIRRRPSSRAYILLGYLPTTRLENVPNKARKRRQITNLYHACVSRILQPLESAGVDGILLSTGSGQLHRGHPILAAFIGDYPEQLLVTLGLNGDCPQCPQVRDKLGDYDDDPKTNASLHDLDRVLDVLDTFDTDTRQFLQACSAICLKPCPCPFWLSLPLLHIYRSITPDILHQMYQGVIKHLIQWVISIFGAAEIDARCRRLPPNHNTRVFSRGISSLSRVTGQEHDQMSRFLLGLVIDIQLPDGLSNARLFRSIRAIMDFLYYSQYPIHTDATLKLMSNALNRFHLNKDIFIDLGIRNHFNIPKFHFVSHYVDLITLFGTTDNFNTQYTERLHIDYAKDAYAATNKKSEYMQMTKWLERKEKIQCHEQYIKWQTSGNLSLTEKCPNWIPPGLDIGRTMSLSNRPAFHSVPLEEIVTRWQSPLFKIALCRFISIQNKPNLTPQQLEQSLWDIHLPFRALPVWKVIKFLRVDPVTRAKSTADSIHVKPAHLDSKGHHVGGRFDTTLVNEGNGKDYGIEGYGIARLKVIFSIPKRYHDQLFNLVAPEIDIPNHLAYVEWYSPLETRDQNHRMFKISPLKDREGTQICSVVPLAAIRRSVHLIPRFGPVAPGNWSSSNVLDECGTFFLNDFTDKHLFRIVCSQ